MNKTTQDAVNQYELLNPLLTGIYKEMQELSKKKPDSPLNAFKVKAINRILEPIKEMLKMENTHAFLDVLDVDEMPTNSDVVLVLNQYMNAMKIFYEKYESYKDWFGKPGRLAQKLIIYAGKYKICYPAVYLLRAKGVKVFYGKKKRSAVGILCKKSW